jgi:DNA polymerase elongation subunit (family B)
MKFYTNVFYTGSSILCREYEDGKSNMVRDNFSPCVFLPTQKPRQQKTVDGRSVEPIFFNNVFEMNEFKEKYSGIDRFEIHGDINGEYQYMGEKYENDFPYDPQLIKIMYIDIETTAENGFPNVDNPIEKVTVISTIMGNEKKVFCLGKFTPKTDIEVHDFDDEQDLLLSFCEYMNHARPDIMSGWNIKFFDIPYLVNRCSRLLDEKEVKYLSPWGIIKKKMVEKNNEDHTTFELVGISVMDYYDLYKTFTYVKQESYSLNHIAYVELGKEKIDYSEYETIRDFYTQNFQKFVEYNIVDCELVLELENKMRLMELAISLAYSAKVNFVDVFSQVRTWDAIIYNYLKPQNIIIPPRKQGKKDSQYAGAYVKDPQVGMHDWILSYDVNSLYPSLIIHLNISPETLQKKNFIGKINIDDIIRNDRKSTTFEYLNEAKELNCTIAANGTMYTKKKIGFLPELMDKMYKERKHYKDLMIKAEKDLEAVKHEIQRRGLTIK